MKNEEQAHLENLSTKALASKVALGRLLVQLLENDNDSRALAAQTRLEQQVSEIEDMLRKRTKVAAGTAQVVGMKSVRMSGQIGVNNG